MIEGRFTFHGIGQGLFYSGIIRNNLASFNFVYDCGTLYKKDSPLLAKEINSCFSKSNNTKGNVNALFISHLHHDHISGLPQLFKNYTVENVFMPYFSPEELLLICTENHMFLDPELLHLFINPADYFAEYGVKNVYLISPNEDIPHNEYNEEDLYPETSFKINGDFQPIKTIYETNIFKGKNISFSDFNVNWIFKIYQDQTEKQQKEIRNEILKICKFIPYEYDSAKIKQLLCNKDFIEKSKKIYDKVKHKINQSSLVLYHSPITNTRNHISTCYTQKCCGCCPGCYNPHNSPATLLTGDINLNHLTSKGDKLEDFLYDCPKHIGFFQIPHHGSYKNMSLNIINKLLPNYMEKICSYGKHNQFRHPDAYMLDELMQNSYGKIYHVTQNNEFLYFVKIE